MTGRTRVDMTDGATRTILVHRIGHLGDALVALPAIACIRSRHPDHRLVLVTDRHHVGKGYVSSWDVLGPTGWFDEVVFYTPRRGLRGAVRLGWEMVRRLRRMRPTHAFDLAPQRARRAVLPGRRFFSHAVGVGEYHVGTAFVAPPRQADGTLPRIEPEWQRLLRIAGGGPQIGWHPDVPEAYRREAADLLAREGVPARGLKIAVGPGSKMPAKQWPLERFAELGHRLLAADSTLQLLVLGGPRDAAIGDVLTQAWGSRAFNLAGRLSVWGSAGVLERCALYVGNDTGTMHLAAVVGVPCVALFSARDYPGKWEPFGNGHSVLRHETACAGCMQEVCDIGNQCLAHISVDAVLARIRRSTTTSPNGSVARTAGERR